MSQSTQHTQRTQRDKTAGSQRLVSMSLYLHTYTDVSQASSVRFAHCLCRECRCNHDHGLLGRMIPARQKRIHDSNTGYGPVANRGKNRTKFVHHRGRGGIAGIRSTSNVAQSEPRSNAPLASRSFLVDNASLKVGSDIEWVDEAHDCDEDFMPSFMNSELVNDPDGESQVLFI